MDIDTLNNTIISCRKCVRLVEYRESVAKKKKRAYQDWVYWGKPVPAFGDILGRIMVVGLAPGPHGSNRTGRMFTGDASGYSCLQLCIKQDLPTRQYQ
jgi:uracil-DNA glycosylase